MTRDEVIHKKLRQKQEAAAKAAKAEAATKRKAELALQKEEAAAKRKADAAARKAELDRKKLEAAEVRARTQRREEADHARKMIVLQQYKAESSERTKKSARRGTKRKSTASGNMHTPLFTINHFFVFYCMILQLVTFKCNIFE